MDFLSWLRESQQQITVVAFIFVIGTLAFIIRSLVADNAERVDELSKRVDEYDQRLNSLDSTIAQRIAEVVEGELTDIKNGALQTFIRELLGECCCQAPISCLDYEATVKSTFTLLYENARLNLDGELTPESVGIKLTEGHKRRLDRIVDAFAACVRPPRHTVEFKVLGYASTAEFQEERSDGSNAPMPNSGELNRQAARQRAEVVVDYLKEQGNFKVVGPKKDEGPNARNSVQDMAPPYLDRSEVFSGKAQEALNRMVLIRVVDAGACSKERTPASS